MAAASTQNQMQAIQKMAHINAASAEIEKQNLVENHGFSEKQAESHINYQNNVAAKKDGFNSLNEQLSDDPYAI